MIDASTNNASGKSREFRHCRRFDSLLRSVVMKAHTP